MTTKNDRYNEAVDALDKFIQDHHYTPWQPESEQTKINTRCVYLYGGEKQYAKIDSRFKIVIEYSAPGVPTLKDNVKRAGDYGHDRIAYGKTTIGPGGRITRG